jgi:tRNA dimethylallyltransferase
MDIGTSKITKKERQGIPHYLLDVASPKRRFTVVQYRKLALKAINKILRKGKLPIFCGGTGFYIQAVVDGIIIPEVSPDWKLRKKLEKKSVRELYQMLKKLDPGRAKTIEKKNPRRLIRAIEIVLKTKRPVPILKVKPLPYPVLMIGVKLSKEKLQKRIRKRVERMIKMGLEKEARKFPLQAIGYQEWSSLKAKDLIIQHTIQYAKRQMTWFKKDKRINWIKKQAEAEKLVREFLGK